MKYKNNGYSIEINLPKKYTRCNDVQFSNAFGSMYFTLLGMSIMLKLVHPLKTEFPIDVNSFDKTTLCKFVHPSNALGSIYFTLLGIVILVNL